MRQHRHRIVSWVGIGLTLISAVTLAPRLTLCVADDGHVVLEALCLTERCTADYRRHHGEPSSGQTMDVDDHGCTDTTLSAPFAAGRHEASAEAFVRPVVTSVMASSVQRAATPLAARADVPDARLAHAALATVVILA